MLESTPKISIVIPAYNCAKYIPQLFNNMLNQTMKDFEIIVAIDACPHGTLAAINDFTAKTPVKNLTVIEQKTNKGPAAARNAAISVARGEYLHFMDADDLIDLDFYERLYAAATETDSDIACCTFINERYPKENVVYHHKLLITLPQDKIDYTKSDVHGFSQKYLIRREYWNSNGFQFPEDMRQMEDVEIMTRVVGETNRIILVPDVAFHYKWRTNSILTTVTKEKIAERKAARKRAFGKVREYLNERSLLPSACPMNVHRFKLFSRLVIAKTCEYPDRGTKHYYIFGIKVMKRTHFPQRYR